LDYEEKEEIPIAGGAGAKERNFMALRRENGPRPVVEVEGKRNPTLGNTRVGVGK